MSQITEKTFINAVIKLPIYFKSLSRKHEQMADERIRRNPQ
jgi:hypothetical protein